MQQDFLALGFHDQAHFGRAACVEICAHAFYGKSWCLLRNDDFLRLADGLSRVALGEMDHLEVRYSPAPGAAGFTSLNATRLPRTETAEIRVTMDFPEGTLRTQLITQLESLRVFVMEFRVAWHAPTSTPVELLGC